MAGEHRWGSEREMAALQSPELAPWVKEIGWVRHGDLPALYSLAVAVLLASLYEGFRLADDRGYGSRLPGDHEPSVSMADLAEGAALLVNPVDVDSIAQAIRSVATDDVLRQQLVAAGRERAGQFSWDRCAAATLSLIEQIGAGGAER